MIHEVDEALKALVTRDGLNGLRVELSLDSPTKDWNARRTGPTVNLYLYEIREDPARREVAYEEIRDESGMVVDRRQPPRRIRLYYAVTAWAQRPEDEHRILSLILACFLKHDAIPQDLLTGALVDQPLPVRIGLSTIPTTDFQMSLNDMWARLDGDYHAALDLLVTVPFDAGRGSAIAPPVLEEPRLQISGPSGSTEELRRSRTRPKREPQQEQPVAEEVLNAGTPNQPGRILRVRGTTG
jgi:hypothetical protein